MAIITTGPCRLQGLVPISGSKNASLPLIASHLLFKNELKLANIPDLIDIGVLLHLLRDIGSEIIVFQKHLSFSYQKHAKTPRICAQKAAKIRASILLLAPFLGRYGEILLPLPGGCNIGKRPIDFHLYALEQLGAEFSVEENAIYGSLPDGMFKGGHIVFPKPTVTGTENAIMAAAIAVGRTRIENAAQDDEVLELIYLLRSAGVQIQVQADVIEIEGHSGLLNAPASAFSICADRMEAGTFLAACGMTRGDITLQYERCPGLDPVLDHLAAMGMVLHMSPEGLRAQAPSRLKARSFSTAPHPGFPTDLQAPFLALNCVSEGPSAVTETIWENRFIHAHEFMKMGAKITMLPNQACIQGGAKLHGAEIAAHDLRGSAASILMGLCAEGSTIIHHAETHYERGYSFFIEKLQRLGASIDFIKDSSTADQQHHINI